MAMIKEMRVMTMMMAMALLIQTTTAHLCLIETRGIQTVSEVQRLSWLWLLIVLVMHSAAGWIK